MEVVELKGTVDSTNAKQIEETILEQLSGSGDDPVTLDAAELKYISSAGLRAVLQIRKEYPELSIINVSPEIYEILEITGFTEMMTIQRRHRTISVEGCEVIGEGANGKVFRIDRDTIVKTYKNADALDEIRRERENARLALILGIPTAISYDVVKVGDSYGAVFELLNNQSFSSILAREPDRMEWCVREFAGLLKTIHHTIVPDGKLPVMKELALQWISRIRDELPAHSADKLIQMVSEIPDQNTMLHGDYHTKNIVLAGDEVMLIDMDTLAVGHPVFEFAQMYFSFIGFGEYEPETVSNFLGYDAEKAKDFWQRSLQSYFETNNTSVLSEITSKIRCIAYARLIDWCNRHMDQKNERTQKQRDNWIRELTELLEHVDSLVF